MKVKNLLLIIVGATAVFSAHYVFLVFGSRLSYSEMDLDQSGMVSYTEALILSGSDTRLTIVKGNERTEYYALKDGLPIQVVCKIGKP